MATPYSGGKKSQYPKIRDKRYDFIERLGLFANVKI
jgi:hypothetical protein